MNTRRLFIPALLVALASLAGCGDSAKPAPIDLSKYDRSCTADADCIAVETDPCAVCACPSAAINTKAKAAFTAEVNASAAQCPNQGGPTPPCVPCEATATCKNAVCTTVTGL